MDLISFKPAYYFSIQIKEIIQIFAQTDLFGNRKINRAFKLENKWARNIGVNRSAPREPANRVTRLCTIHGILSDLASQIRPPSGPSPRLQEILQEILKGFVTASLRKRKLVFEKKLILNPSPEIKKIIELHGKYIDRARNYEKFSPDILFILVISLQL